MTGSIKVSWNNPFNINNIGDEMKAGMILKSGEKMSKETTINGKKVIVQCSTKNNKVDYVCHFELDYTGISEQQLLKLATRSLVIDLQREIRVAKVADAKKLFDQKLSVKDVLATRKKQHKTEAEKAADLMKGKTKEEVDAMVAAAKALLG